MTGPDMSGPQEPSDGGRPPERVLAAARAAYRMRRPDAVPAELTADSAAEPAVGLRRGPASGPRLLTFDAGDVTVHLHVTAHGDVCDVAGQLLPPGRYEVELRRAAGATTHPSDPGGAFVLRSVPCGPVSLVCSRREGGARALSTPWTII